ncbi:DUF5318 family protein [Corynebacterium liangguodongii]|uniref:Uncharacterized protein n=1 Tax=Corynebacterium liangguodongii TaxID=2079535 RepID=A0A2S0WHH2_9CORY|nr:DUF5318 family protein [Corynebacterium liangguodongii]AWB85176.1 hypothetical protein C3E79_10830 [Corynebacterium liangguodongii]PWB99423.1 hypothetical protein DF219_07445 [Corynebacterium liangguodongii]
MFDYSHEISHEWQRRTTLKRFRAGLVRREAICDADFLLCAAARYHGTDAARPCPVCEETMRNVLWIYGEDLGRRSGTARSEAEIDDIVHEVGPVSVHTVEVCLNCRWNYLLKEVTAAPVV